MSTHSPGAVRAAERIGNLAGFPPIFVNYLAEMIDAETACKELAKGLSWCLEQFQGDSGTGDHHWSQFNDYIDAKAAIAKWEGRA